MADAVFSASFLNGCRRNASSVQMACMAPVVNVRGPLFVHPKGFVKRTTFHVLKMYSNPRLPNVVSGKIGTEPMRIGATLDAVATCSDDRRKLAIAMVNRHDAMPAQWKLSLCQLNSAKATRRY
ncbi:MAG: alpha-N-arabinofuranosidase [Edaphobacter sp.]|nr:alpha-N-arabinofuranosidase [Edaphobacter sp.]